MSSEASRKIVDGDESNGLDLSCSEARTFISEEKLKLIVKSHHGLIKISVMSVLVSLLAVTATVVTVVKDSPKNNNFATTSDGRILKLTPLNEPLLTLRAVEAFAGRAVSNTFTFDYVNYNKQISASEESYTSNAFKEIQKNLESKDGIITQAIKNSWTVTSNVMAAPTVPESGSRSDGRYAWHLVFPVKITFQSETTVRSAKYKADVVVVRVSQNDNPSGIAISKLSLTPYRYGHE